LASAKTAKQELMTVRYMLDREMRKAVPQWGEYLRGYRSASREADQVRVGQRLLDKGATATESAITGERTLTPAKVSGLTNNADALVQGATGFRKASAERVLTPRQQDFLRELRADMSRVETSNNLGRSVGSPTAQNQGTLRQISGAAAGALPIPQVARRVIASGENAYQAQLDNYLGGLLANPDRAREVLAKLPTAQRLALERQLAGYAATASNLIAAPSLQK
jgi:hypothetical protein